MKTTPPEAAAASAAQAPETCVRERHFLSYRGVQLPLQLMQELDADGIRHRNTWYTAGYDAQDRLRWIEQRVYGEVALRHDYRWHADGRLAEAVIQQPDEDPVIRRWD